MSLTNSITDTSKIMPLQAIVSVPGDELQDSDSKHRRGKLGYGLRQRCRKRMSTPVPFAINTQQNPGDGDEAHLKRGCNDQAADKKRLRSHRSVWSSVWTEDM